MEIKERSKWVEFQCPRCKTKTDMCAHIWEKELVKLHLVKTIGWMLVCKECKWFIEYHLIDGPAPCPHTCNHCKGPCKECA